MKLQAVTSTVDKAEGIGQQQENKCASTALQSTVCMPTYLSLALITSSHAVLPPHPAL